jgi:hypothetical protein
MTLVVPNIGDQKSLAYIVGSATNGNLKLHLYNNNYTPSKGDTLSNYTESIGAGYAAQTLTSTTWTIATVSNVTTATYSAVTFTYTGADNLYGYYVTDAASANLLWAEAFPSVFNIPSAGGSVTVTPVLGAN